MPITNPQKFKDALFDWVTTSERGSQLKSDNVLGFMDEGLKYMKVTAESRGRARDAYNTNYPIYMEWENYMQAYRLSAPKSM